MGHEDHLDLRTPGGSRVFAVLRQKQVTQEHVILVSPGPPVTSRERYTAEVLATILGDGSGSRLYWSLVDPGLVESADCSFHEYLETGAFYISFSCEPAQAQRNLATVHGIIQQVQQNGITKEELEQARSKVLSRTVRDGERPMGRLHTIGLQQVYCNVYHTLDEDLQLIEAVSRKRLRELLERYPLNRPTTLALGPLDKLRRPRVKC
jgi:predicted Zn-dependent peptidase